MDGVLIFVCSCFLWSTTARLTSLSLQAGLFSGVLTAFVVPQIQTLQANSADRSVYYQNQSAQILDRISQQLASVGGQIPTNVSPPPPYPTPPSRYPTFHASASDRRVNIFWLISLVCSLSAALLATLVQQWVRSYIRKSSNPLKTARIRLFLLEGTERIPVVAEVVPGLIHISLILFFWGLGDYILQIDTTVFVSTVVPLGVCVCLYLYCVVAPIRNPQSPYRTPFSGIIWNFIRKLHRRPHSDDKVAKLASMEVRQEHFAMEETDGRMDRDVRAIRWLIDNINGSNEMQTFVLAIPGSFNQEWGRDVWRGVVSDAQSTPIVDSQIQPLPGLPSSRGRTTVFDLCRCVRYFFETYSNEGDSTDTKERRMHVRGCVETAASLVCCTELKLSLFGEVGEVLSALGDKERTNDPLTIRSYPSFTVRWTCLSLVAIWEMVDGNVLQELAKFALDRIARFQGGQDDSVSKALKAAQRIDDYLKEAWARVVDLHLAFEPWSQNRNKTGSEIREILNSREASISKLEHIATEAVGVEDLDWRISLLQEAIDEATHKLTRRLPGVFFNELRPAGPIMISEAFDLSSVEMTPISPQLIFPGQQIQSLCTLGRRLRDIIDEQNTERHKETLEILESLSEIPVALRGLNYPMKRQIWRLLDLHDGSGLGFTVELFFLALRQLSSTSSSSELKKVIYTGTFKVISSNWEKSKNSAGTQRVLLDLVCDLVIRSRGVFSDFSYPTYIVDMLLDLVEDMVEGHGGEHPHINDIIQELEDDDLWNRMDSRLRGRALNAICSDSYSDTPSEDSNPANADIVWPQVLGGTIYSDPETVVEGQGSAEGRT